MIDIKKFADIQIRDWRTITTKNKKKVPIIPENIKFEKINWETTQQKQQLAKILEKSEKNLNLPDTENNKNTSETATKLEQNIKEIQKNINWKKKNSIIQTGYWSYNPQYLYYR